ncbi:hypothetical protein [Chryseobacterium sp. 6424]|nr:hypothetical protein [Chryseobacterium sp. 6424]
MKSIITSAAHILAQVICIALGATAVIGVGASVYHLFFTGC